MMNINQMIQDLNAIGLKVYTDIDLLEEETQADKEAIKRQNNEIMEQRAQIKAQRKLIKDKFR